MSRAQDSSSNKKEIEKQKALKKREKAERMEERKANSGKGKSLEEMLAYVDENGNIVDTPPDPNKRKEINTEDIEIGVRRSQEADTPAAQRKGTITNFNDAKGYGFIRSEPNGESIFVHVSSLLDKVREGDKVTFDVERGPKGLNAVQVRKA